MVTNTNPEYERFSIGVTAKTRSKLRDLKNKKNYRSMDELINKEIFEK